jgi:hypothetical protein
MTKQMSSISSQFGHGATVGWSHDTLMGWGIDVDVHCLEHCALGHYSMFSRIPGFMGPKIESCKATIAWGTKDRYNFYISKEEWSSRAMRLCK